MPYCHHHVLLSKAKHNKSDNAQLQMPTPSLLTKITGFNSPLQGLTQSLGFPVSPGTPVLLLAGGSKPTGLSSIVFQHSAMLFQAYACPICVHLQHFVVSPLPVTSWLSTVRITQGMHLRFILTCHMLLTSFFLGKRKAKGNAHVIFVLSRWWSSIAGCSHQVSEMLIVSIHGVPKVLSIQLMLFGCSLSLKPSRRGKLSSHHVKSPTFLFGLKYINCKQHSNLCIL